MSGANEQIRKRMKAQVLLQSKTGSRLAFCIVHWNAPDFLLLNVNQIELLYPNSKIYIFDNSSEQVHLASIKAGLEKFTNVTLFNLVGIPKWAKKLHLDMLFEWQSHSAGLQFLLNYAAKQSDEIAVFLDQDCILSTRVDDLFSKFSEDVILIGARDRWRGHASANLIHPSFMILQPNRIFRLFGNSCLYDERTKLLPAHAQDPYHGISLKALGKMLYLEPQIHTTIPLLTSYGRNGVIFAWHAWYSSRTVGMNSGALEGYPVSWLRNVRKLEYDFMMQIHKDTADELQNL